MSALPATMTGIEISSFGAPEVLKPATRPVPVAGVGEVLVKVEAAGVNRPDIAQRIGNYPPPPGVSDLPGLEIAGEIAAIGPGVTDRKVGDRVTALVAGGGYAEYCVAPAVQCLPIPRGFDAVQAAAIPETWFTVWDHVVDRCNLKPGETFLVHGGASGIGTAAIQLAKVLGGRAFATAGTDKKVAACIKLGCEQAINYRTGDFAKVLKEATGGKGIDVILDMVAGAYVPKNIDLLAMDGRMSFVAALGGGKSDGVPIQQIMMKRLTLTGTTLRRRPVEYKARIASALRHYVWPRFEDGTVAPVIDAVFPLAKAADAHRHLEENGHIGKVMLKI